MALLPFVRSVGTHFPLSLRLARREVAMRYKGSVGGFMWTLVNPALMLAIYTLVFGYIFKGRWPQAGEVQAPGEFAVILFAGLVPFNLFAECLARAPNLVLANPSYVTKVVFPLPILPVVSVLGALFHALASLCVLILAQWLVFGHIPFTALLLPVVWLPVLLWSLAVGWWLSALGVYLRDIGQVSTLLATMLMFLSPIFYPLSVLPDWLQPWLWLNPMAQVVEAGRDVLLWGRGPDWFAWLLGMLAGGVAAATGYVWFRATRKGFADVM